MRLHIVLPQNVQRRLGTGTSSWDSPGRFCMYILRQLQKHKIYPQDCNILSLRHWVRNIEYCSLFYVQVAPTRTVHASDYHNYVQCVLSVFDRQDLISQVYYNVTSKNDRRDEQRSWIGKRAWKHTDLTFGRLFMFGSVHFWLTYHAACVSIWPAK